MIPKPLETQTGTQRGPPLLASISMQKLEDLKAFEPSHAGEGKLDHSGAVRGILA